MNKTLFIFSNDFGEIVLLRFLLYQQPLHVFLALPERLYDYVDFPNATKFLYRDGAELNTVLEEVQPEQVMLFSAYLLAPNGLISFPEFYELLDYLDNRKIPVSTSDPFMRYYDQLEYEYNEATFHSNVRNTLKQLSERLSGYRHLYSVPVQFDGAPHQSFSNSFKCEIPEKKHDKQEWTFIMASEDFKLLQVGNAGMYHKTLVPLLRSLVTDYDIHVNLVFPEDFYTILKTELADVSNINFVSYCRLDEFEELVAQSDLMLYWNVFSASTLICRLHNKPTVFLGHGHMETIFPGFLDYIKTSWFPHNDPEILQIDDHFVPSLLKRLETNDPALYQPYYELDSPVDILSIKTEAI